MPFPRQPSARRRLTCARVAIAIGAGLILASSAHAQPNVLLIVTDDQRWDTTLYMPTVRSELIGKGVRFTNAFVVNPVCCPSRATILTGTYSHTNGVWANAGPHGGFARFRDESTVATWLDDVGYQTALAGKYLNGYWPSLVAPTYVPPGWDRWFAFWSRTSKYFDYDVTDGVDVRSYGFEPEDYATDVLAQEATAFIRDSVDPFFLYFAPNAPHKVPSRWAAEPAPRHAGRFANLPPWARPNVNEADSADKPSHMRSLPPVATETIAEFRETQIESLLAVDEAIAAMLAALEESGKLADTLIVFTSDNGHAWGEHRWLQKIAPYEESIRVPLVIRYDRLGLTPHKESRFALNLDLAPTIVEAAGASVDGLEGQSLLPLMEGDTTGWRKGFLFEAYMGHAWGVPPYCAFRDEGWKYVQYRTGEEELYRLTTDRYELQSLRGHNLRRMGYRDRVLLSACRPPGFTPLRLCTITGTPGPDRLRGTSRRDWVCAAESGDRIDVSGGGADTVRCGRGRDRVLADRRDQLSRCERVTWLEA